jgi:hypothetical protein
MTQMAQMFRHRGVIALVLVLAVLMAAAVVMIPPAPLGAPALTSAGFTARGAYHVHSRRSDGSGTVDEIAQAAQRAGLQFVILTDHGDGTRQPDPPQYRHGVLMIDAVELNTTGGHLVALGLPATPYPFAGTAADVLEDVHRLGGIGIAAHPDAPRAGLRWESWDADLDGLEWLNADSAWRDESSAALAQALFGYLFRAPGAMASVFDRPTDLLARWDGLGATRSLTALAGADAHARLGADDPDASSLHLALPGYESVFRTFSNHVALDRALTGDGAADASAILAVIRRGRTFTALDALATPGGLTFVAETAAGMAGMGDVVPVGGDVTIRANISGPPGITVVLLRDGVPVHDVQSSELVFPIAAVPGVYRLEVHVPGGPGTPPVPWLFSNPIYVGVPRVPRPPTQVPDPVSRIPARTAEAAAEHGPGDVSELVDAQLADARDRRLAGELPLGWRFALAPGAASGQFAALQVPASGGLEAFERVRFTVTSVAPIRAWVQLRAGQAAERWGRTFYADEEPRMVELPLRAFLSIGVTSTATPPLAQVTSLLFVVDTMNSRPGASGSMTISDVAFVR